MSPSATSFVIVLMSRHAELRACLINGDANEEKNIPRGLLSTAKQMPQFERGNSRSFAPLTLQMMPHLRGPKPARLRMTEDISCAGINKTARIPGFGCGKA